MNIHFPVRPHTPCKTAAVTDVYVIGTVARRLASTQTARLPTWRNGLTPTPCKTRAWPLSDARLIEQAWFGNCGMGQWGQGGLSVGRCVSPRWWRRACFPERVPMVNVEGGCATASLAFHGAWKDILSGQCQGRFALWGLKTHTAQTGPSASLKFLAPPSDQARTPTLAELLPACG